MKTTNFFVDFIVVGVIGILALLVPIAMISHTAVLDLADHADTIIKLTPVLTVATYAFGVLFNQVADRVDDLLVKWLSIPWLVGISRRRRALAEEYGVTDHDCVQYVVLRSSAAYEYLSFRRSVLRIIRAMVTTCIIILLSHPISILLARVAGSTLEWSMMNGIVILSTSVVLTFLLYTLGKLGVGYYSAVGSFYMSLHEKGAFTQDTRSS